MGRWLVEFGIDSFRKLTQIDPKAAPGFVFLGISEYKLKEYDEALRDLDSARLLGLPNGHPVTTAARYYLALLLNRNGMHDAAAELLLSLSTTGGASEEICEAFGLAGLRIAKLPDEVSAEERQLARSVGQALAAAGQRRQAEALASLAGLVKQHPSQPNLHYIYGTLLLEAEPAKAVEEFQEELKVQPGSVPARLALAHEFERQNRLAEARADAEGAVKLEPDNFETHATLGRILAAQDQLAEALKELERAKALESGSPQIYFALASVYAKLGRSEDAQNARAEFLRLRRLADEQK
jgi:predicted Zn-dependent protease